MSEHNIGRLMGLQGRPMPMGPVIGSGSPMPMAMVHGPMSAESGRRMHAVELAGKRRSLCNPIQTTKPEQFARHRPLLLLSPVAMCWHWAARVVAQSLSVFAQSFKTQAMCRAGAS